MKLKIALAQMDVIPNQPEKNLQTIKRFIEQARTQYIDIIVFPEMCIGGYLLGDRWLEPEFCQDLMNYNEDLREASKGITLIYGNIYYDSKIYHSETEYHPNKDGRVRKYNAVYIIQDQQYCHRQKESIILPLGVQPKTLLPNYRIFDDERYFFSLQDICKDYGSSLAEQLQPFKIFLQNGEEILIGVEICEDLWCEDYRQEFKPINPTQYLIQNGAQMIINVSASPWTYKKNDARDRRVKYLYNNSSKFVPFLYVNNIGAQNNGKNIITFDGGTTVYNNQGDPVIFSKPYIEELIYITETELKLKGSQRIEKSKIAQKYEAIQTGLKHLNIILNRQEPLKYVIGVSGGVDSAVVCALLVKTMGKENVMAINLPSQFNSQLTQNIAYKVTKALDIPYIIIPISDLVNENIKILENANFDNKIIPLSTLNIENIQAKIRGTTILSNLAAKYGAIFTCNGNKMEIALGYATLYGDVNGAIAPLGDLTKTEIYDLAQYLNKEVFHKEVIPFELFPDDLYQYAENHIAPSPELKEKQINPLKWGYHDAVIEYAYCDFQKANPVTLLRWFLEGSLEENLHISTNLLQRWGLTNPTTFIEDTEWFIHLYYQNVFKRVQAPPIIITSRSAFGFDNREAQLPWIPSRSYLQLKEKVLKLSKYQPKIIL